MIDWPNLIAGFLIGLIPTLTIWLVDRSRVRRQRVREAKATLYRVLETL